MPLRSTPLKASRSVLSHSLAQIQEQADFCGASELDEWAQHLRAEVGALAELENVAAEASEASAEQPQHDLRRDTRGADSRLSSSEALLEPHEGLASFWYSEPRVINPSD